MTIDITESNRGEVTVKWKDANGKTRIARIDFAAGYSHGQLCLGMNHGASGHSSLAFLTESGELDFNSAKAQTYRKQ
jgi:hypothetical protein